MKRLLLALALVLTSCSSISEGTVIAKRYQPERHYVTWIPIQVGQTCTGGKYPVCTPIMVPFPFHMVDDEDFVIVIKNCPKDASECKTGERFIGGRAEWEAIDEGQWWSDEEKDGIFSASDKPKRLKRVSKDTKTDDLPENRA